MPTHMTPDELGDRTRRATAAAVDAGRRLGLEVNEPVVLHDVFSVVVHLAPSPVVARVPTVLPEGRQDPAQVSARQRVELDVVSWLRDKGAPIVSPSPLVPTEPVVTGEFSMTMWQWVGVDPGAELDVVGNAPDVAELHRLMRDYPGELPFLPAVRWIPDALRYLESNPGLVADSDLARARREWSFLEPILSSPRSYRAQFGDMELQPLHGDAPAVNILVTPQGKLYADFEDPMLASVEWDMGILGPEAAAAYNAAAADKGQRQLNPEILAMVDAVANVQVVACYSMVPRLPVLAEYLEYPLAEWRNKPEIQTVLAA